MISSMVFLDVSRLLLGYFETVSLQISRVFQSVSSFLGLL